MPSEVKCLQFLSPYINISYTFVSICYFKHNVFEVLHSYGLKNGDTVICGHLELGYYDDEIWGEGSKV